MKINTTITILLFCSMAFAKGGGSHASHSSSVSVKGYTKANGTHVAASHRSAPDHTQNNNYSTKGNTNPYTGKKGTKKPKD